MFSNNSDNLDADIKKSIEWDMEFNDLLNKRHRDVYALFMKGFYEKLQQKIEENKGETKDVQ